MKNFLGIAAALIVIGLATYHIAAEREVQAANAVCARALTALAQPTAERTPHFVKLDVDAALSETTGDADFVIRANARVVTTYNTAPNLLGPDYSIACRVKDGALADAVWLRAP